MSKVYDCIIVGAGPSGSILGYELASKGFSTIILEKERLPRYKVCAGGLPHRICELLDFDLSSITEDRITKIEFTHKLEDRYIFQNDEPFAYTVKREKFDYFLTQRSKKEGCEIKTGEKVTKVEIDRDRVDVITSRNRYKAKILVGGDGVRSVVADKFHITRRAVTTIEAEVKFDDMKKHQGMMKIDWGIIPFGYAWALPKKDVLSVGIGALKSRVKNLKGYFERWLEYCGIRDQKMKVYTFSVSLGGLKSKIAGERTCLIGDAGNFVHPLTAEGIYYGVKSANLASIAIEKALRRKSYNLSEYQELVEREIYPHFKKLYLFSGFLYTFSKLGYTIWIKNNRTLFKYFFKT